MTTQSVAFTSFINRGIHPAFTQQVASVLTFAYDEAHKRGEITSYLQDEESKERLLPSLEQERLSDAQGIYAQHYLHRFASGLPGVIAEFGENTRHRPHVQIKTDFARLTSHRIKKPGDFPPYAAYRETNASDNQCWLIEPSPTEPIENTGQVYLYLLHGPSTSEPTQLGFIQIGAPSPTGNGYIAIIDLYKHEDFSIAQQEVVADNVVITLKTDLLQKMYKANGTK